jgi:hypothetical protein
VGPYHHQSDHSSRGKGMRGAGDRSGVAWVARGEVDRSYQCGPARGVGPLQGRAASPNPPSLIADPGFKKGRLRGPRPAGRLISRPASDPRSGSIPGRSRCELAVSGPAGSRSRLGIRDQGEGVPGRCPTNPGVRCRSRRRRLCPETSGQFSPFDGLFFLPARWTAPARRSCAQCCESRSDLAVFRGGESSDLRSRNSQLAIFRKVV